MAHNKKVDVFISYSRKNTECADAICAAFDKAGITYFIDRQGIKIEQDYIEKIANEIDNSKMVLFLASADSYRSKYINIELQYAFNNGVPILPYQIDDTKITKKWQMLLSNANWYNIHEHPFHSTLITTVAEHVGKEVYLDESNKPVDPQPHKHPRLRKILMIMCLSLIGIYLVLAIILAIDRKTLRYEYNYINSSASVVANKDTLLRYIGNIEIPSSVKHRGVLFSVDSIGPYAFEKCSDLTSITIPNSVKSIGGGAFLVCESLTSVTIPNSVTEIGVAAFASCKSLTSIVVEQGNVKYDSRDNCNAIIETASNTLISGCQNTTIPNSVTSIGSLAFANCYGLTSITIPNSVTSIGDYAFYYCSGLTSITIPNSVTSIGDKAFLGCIGLTSITIPNSVTSIGDSAFYCCAGLTSITIPNSVTRIGDGAFESCFDLTSITIPNSVTSIGWAVFLNCSSLTSITIPNSVTEIGSCAFEHCTSLTSVTVPSHTKIAEDAFPPHTQIIRK